MPEPSTPQLPLPLPAHPGLTVTTWSVDPATGARTESQTRHLPAADGPMMDPRYPRCACPQAPACMSREQAKP
jgi:hypothetical protein